MDDSRCSLRSNLVAINGSNRQLWSHWQSNTTTCPQIPELRKLFADILYGDKKVDVVSKGVRSRMMSGIKGKNTKPEILIRHALHKLGFRYRLHDKTLPGKPDLVFPKYRAVILINGCFWHGHECDLFKWPKTRETFWRSKIAGTIERDTKNLELYEKLGWRVLTIWECSIKGSFRRSPEEVALSAAGWLKSINEIGVKSTIP